MKGLLRPGKAGTGSAVPKVDYRGDPWRYGESQPEYGVVAFNRESVKGLYAQCALRGIPLFIRRDASSSDLTVLIYKSETKVEEKSWDVYAEELGLSAEEKARVEASALEHTDRTGLVEEVIRYAWCRDVWFPKTVLHFLNSEGKMCVRLAGNGRAKLHVRDGWDDVTVVDSTSFSYAIVESGEVAVYGHNLVQAWLERVSNWGTLEDGNVGELPPVEEEYDRDDWYVARSDGEPSYPVPWRANKKGLITLSMWQSGEIMHPLGEVIPGGTATGGGEVGFYNTLTEAAEKVVGDRYGEIATGGGYSETRDVSYDVESLRARFKSLVPKTTTETLEAWLPNMSDETGLARPGVYRDSEGKLVAIISNAWDGVMVGGEDVARVLWRDSMGTTGKPWSDPGTRKLKAGDLGTPGVEYRSAGVATDVETRTVRAMGRYLEAGKIRGDSLPVKVEVTLHIGARTAVAGEFYELLLPMYAQLKGNVGREGGEKDVQELEVRYNKKGKARCVVPAHAILEVEDVGGTLCYKAHQTVTREFELLLGKGQYPSVILNNEATGGSVVWEGYHIGDWDVVE